MSIVDEDKFKLFREGKYNSTRWSSEEKPFRHTRKFREKIFSRYTYPFTSALLQKYKNSVLGTYLDIFNLAQNQDKGLNENKLGITQWNIQRYGQKELKWFYNRNTIFEDCIKAVNDAVKDCQVINLDYMRNKTTRLELNNSYINLVDADLRKFVNVTILVLMGNNLRDLKGSCLPRGLLYLELYNNFISDIKNLVKRAPKHLMHLGLGRNKLTEACGGRQLIFDFHGTGQALETGEGWEFGGILSVDVQEDTNEVFTGFSDVNIVEYSSLHLLAESGLFQRLQNLDLSGNDIYILENAMFALAGLKWLKSFSLQGNPCAVVVRYTDIVLHYLPNIQYFDYVEVLKSDSRNSNTFEGGDNEALIVFNCYRIMGLPKPPKDKSSVSTIHVEVEFSLMEPVHFSEEETPKEEQHDNEAEGNKHRKDSDVKSNSSKQPSKKSKDVHSKDTKSTARGKKSSPYLRPNEYNPVREKNNFYFKSARMPWAKIIEFPPVLIESPEGNLVSVRDTFRSMVNVRVVYLKVGEYRKKKKKEKGHKKDKKSAKSNKHESETIVRDPVETGEPQENILKRVTLCSFFCDMRDVNWSDETIDFYWADHKNIELNAIQIDGCLKEIKYKEDVGKHKPKTVKKGGTETTASTIEENFPNPIPKIFTCQVGFGLKRSLH